MLISGFGAVCFYRLFKKLLKKQRVVAFVGYTVFISIAYILMPQNPDKITVPMELVNGFRAMSFIAVSIFWMINAVILGMLWQKFQPHILSKETKDENYR